MHRDLITDWRARPRPPFASSSISPPRPSRSSRAWIDPGQMGDWYAPSDDFGPTIGQVDPQVGGNYRIRMFPPGARSRIPLRSILHGR